MATAPVPATDFTGRKRAELQKQQADEAKKRQNEISMAHAAEVESFENEIVDTTAIVPVVVDEVTVLEDEADDLVVIRVAEDIEQVTIGNRTYDFVAGRKYKVDKNVRDVLLWAGRLYDRA